MITRRTLLYAVSAVALLEGAPPLADAATPPEEAQTMVKRLSEDAIKLLSDKDLSADERNKRFAMLLTKGFDVPAMGRFALGRYWRDASEQEREDYLKLFEDLIVATYAQRFANYQGESFQVLSSTPEDGDKSVLVHSQIMRVNPPQPP